jgi:hypothetical protein
MASVAIAFSLGIFVAIILSIVIMKFTNTDKKIKTQYDERQEIIRSRGYKYSFYAMLIIEVLFMCIKIADIKLPVNDFLLHLLAMLFGCLVLCVYSIWNDAYWGLNNDRKKYIIIYALVTLFNVAPIVAAFLEGDFRTEGWDALPITNIVVVIWLALIAAAALVKKIVDSRSGEED